MKLLTGPLSMFGMKARIAIAEKGIDCEIESVPFSLKERYSPTHPDVARLNPKKQVPVLLDGSVEIFDSTQIFEYLEDKHPDPALWPEKIDARAEARLWEMKSDEVFFPNFNALMRARGDVRHPEMQAALVAINAYYGEADELLSRRDHIGGTYSFADIAFFCASYFMSFLGGAPDRGLENLSRWRSSVNARPAVAPVVSGVADFLEANGLRAPRI